ncbi:MAG: hypothetical protein KDI30_10930 [Pseudomonadales bacterium]|nr:hypothetical protein [Pseudomonadales bacterium]
MKDKNLLQVIKVLPGLFLLFLCVSSLTLTVFTTLQCYSYQPVGDTWSNPYLFEQYFSGKNIWPIVLELHNNAHLIAVPKLIYLLDAKISQGSGFIIATSSLLFMAVGILACVALLFRDKTLTKTEKVIFSLLATLMLGSILQAESLINPSNLQWSALVAGILCSAFFFSGRAENLKHLYSLGGALSLLLALGSSLNLSVLFVAVLFVFVINRPNWLKRLLLGSMIFLVVFFIWETLNTAVFSVHEPFIIKVYRMLYEEKTAGAADLAPMVSYLHSLGFLSQLMIAGKFLLSLGWFLTPPLKYFLPDAFILFITIGILFLLYRLLTSERQLTSTDKAMLFVVLVCFFTACAASLFRLFVPDAYTLRFANIGLLFLFSFAFLVYKSLPQKMTVRSLYVLCFSGYLAISVWHAWQVANEWVKGQNHIRLSQIAYSLDVQQPGIVVENPYSAWVDDAFDFISRNKYHLKKWQLGIYSDEAYRVYSDFSGLPQKTTDCQIEVRQIKKFKRDRNAYQLVFSVEKNNNFKNPQSLRAVFVNDQLKPLGYARPLNEAGVKQQILAPGQLIGGFLHIPPYSSKTIRVFVFDTDYQCDAALLEMEKSS